jgi:ABC-type amino acid transport substrate-binding protein
MNYPSRTAVSYIKFYFVSVAILLIWPVFLVGASPEQGTSLPNANHIIAVVPPDSPPTYFQDKTTGKAAGFAVDVMNEVAARAGLEVDYIFEDGWSDIIDWVKKGKADAIPGMGVSKDREKELAFSTPIDAFPISLFVRTEHPGIDALGGIHAVGVIKRSVAYEQLKDRRDMRLILYDSFEHGLFDLLAGKIEAFACPEPTLWQLARESRVEERIKVIDRPVSEIRRAIALRKDNDALLVRLNAAIGGFVGTIDYQKLYVKWYGKPTPYWTQVRVTAVGAVVLIFVMTIMAIWRYRSILKLNQKLSIAVHEREDAARTIHRNQERLESLVRISEYRAKDVQDLLDYALEEAIRLTNSRIGYIYHYDEDKREFTLNTWSRDVMQECSIMEPQTIYHLDKTGLWGEAVRQRRPIVMNDFHAHHPLKRGYPMGHAKLFTYLTVPVIRDDRIIAVVGVANKATAYDEDDITQLTLLMAAVWRIVERNQAESALQKALVEIKTLHDILPICSSCKRIRNDKGSWQHLESYISEHTGSEFSHGLCTECAKIMYPQYYK